MKCSLRNAKNTDLTSFVFWKLTQKDYDLPKVSQLITELEKIDKVLITK